MGWQGAGGVLKYYAYYAGPAVFVISAVFIYLLIFKKDFFLQFKQFIKTEGALTLSFLFFFFLFLAEILPRFFNVALLPDRVWVFLGPLFIVPLILILRYKKEGRETAGFKFFPFILILALAVSASGAFYINWQKSYLITREQKEATQWIEKNTEQEAVFFSAGQRNVISSMAGRMYRRVDPYFYLDEKTMGEEINGDSDEEKIRYLTYNDYKREIEEILDEAVKKQDLSSNQEDVIRKSAIGILNRTKIFLRDTRPVSFSEVRSRYIFYSPPSEKNPYIKRPYNRGTQWGFRMQGDFIFDKYQDRFRRIYDQDGVIIWKIL